MNIDEINKRMGELKVELDNPEANLDEIEKEMTDLTEQKRSLEEKHKQEMEKRSRIAEMFGKEKEEEKMMTPEVKPELNKRSSMEYRQAFMDYVTADADTPKYKRAADQIELSDMGVLIPETIIQEIMTGIEKVYGTLYAKVKKTNLRGGVKYPIGEFDATFKRITETTVSERQAAGGVTGYVQFGYNIGEIRIAKTLLQSVLTVPAFEKEVAKVIVRAYVEAMDKEIMTGIAANNQCEGILTEANKSTNSRIAADHIIELTEAEISDWTQWEKKVFAQIPLSLERAGLEFVMSKKTFVSNLVTLKDQSGQPIKKAYFDVNDKQNVFNEYPVLRVEDDILPAFDTAANGDVFAMLWVPSKAYCINSNMQFNVTKYFDHETNQYVTKALVINDGKILNPDYLYLLKKKK